MDILELDKQFKGSNDRLKIKAILTFPLVLKDGKSIDVGFTKLAEYWRQSPNSIRVLILDVISTCAARAKSLSNPKEILSIFLHVLDSNDPIAKALTIRALGILSCISHDSLELQHLLTQCLKDAKNSMLEANQVQLNAAVFSSYQIADLDERFAAKLCDLIFSERLPPIPELCNTFKCLNSIFNVVKGMKQILILLQRNTPVEMRPFLYKSRTLLACRSIIHSSEHIDFLVYQLQSEAEKICFHIYDCLVYLSRKVAHSFSVENIRNILGQINENGVSGRCKARGAELLYNIISSQTYSGAELVNNLRNELDHFLKFTVKSMLTNNFKHCKFIIYFANELLLQSDHELSAPAESWHNIIIESINKGLCSRLHFNLLWSFANSPSNDSFFNNIMYTLFDKTYGQSSCEYLLKYVTKLSVNVQEKVLSNLIDLSCCEDTKIKLLKKILSNTSFSFRESLANVEKSNQHNFVWLKYSIASNCLSVGYPQVAKDIFANDLLEKTLTKETNEWLTLLANLSTSLEVVQTHPNDIKNALYHIILAQTNLFSLQQTNQSFKFEFQRQYLSALVGFLSLLDFSLQDSLPTHQISRAMNEFHRLQYFFLELCNSYFGIGRRSRRILSTFAHLVYLAKLSFSKKVNLEIADHNFPEKLLDPSLAEQATTLPYKSFISLIVPKLAIVPHHFFFHKLLLEMSYQVEALYVSENHELIQLSIKNCMIENKAKHRKIKSVTFTVSKHESGTLTLLTEFGSTLEKQSNYSIELSETIKIDYELEDSVELIVSVSLYDNFDQLWRIGLHQSVHLTRPPHR